MENRTDDASLDLLFGLRAFFTFTNDQDGFRLIKNLISLKFGAPEHKHFIIERVTKEDQQFYTAAHQIATRDSRLALYADFASGEDTSWTVEKILLIIKSILKEEGLIHSLYELTEKFKFDSSARDAFSKGQVTSKVWLVETLQKLIHHRHVFDNIVIIGGWYGHLTHYLNNKVAFNNFYNIDPDVKSGYIGKNYFNKHLSFRYIPSCTTIEQVSYDPEQGYNIPLGEFSVDGEEFKFVIDDYDYVDPDLIINTSCEHMTADWFDAIPAGKMIALQTNNLVDISPDHINCITSIADLEVKYPMTKVLFQGELDINVGKRYMKIGIK